jgi:hypothetical protein
MLQSVRNAYRAPFFHRQVLLVELVVEKWYHVVTDCVCEDAEFAVEYTWQQVATTNRLQQKGSSWKGVVLWVVAPMPHTHLMQWEVCRDSLLRH